MGWLKIFSNEEEAQKAFKGKEARRLSIGGEKVCLTRYNDKYFAVEDKCPHKMASLSEGHVNNVGEIVCPLHNYCFDLKTGLEKDQRTRDAKVFEVELRENGLFINFTE